MPSTFRPFAAALLTTAACATTFGFAARSESLSHDRSAMAGMAPPRLLPVSKAHSFAELMENVDEVMHHDMANAARQGDPDHDFASAMIPHHQGAIDMAKVELLYGKDPALRRMAQEIVVSQQQEIDVMQRRVEAIRANTAIPVIPATPFIPSVPSPKAPS